MDEIYKLRPLEIFPGEYNGKKMIMVRDPVGYVEEIVALPEDFALILQLLDGKHTIRDIQLALTRLKGGLVFSEDIKRVIQFLDQKLLLDTPYFRKKKQEIEKAFEKENVRRAVFKGKSYPESKSLLLEWLDGYFSKNDSCKCFKAIIAPHLDVRSSIDAFSVAYSSFRVPEGARVVILGTGHYLDDFVALTFKDFETPLGVLETDREWLKKLIKLSHLDNLNEFYHKNEHSIEFQCLFLAYVNPRVKIVPVLVGSLHRFWEDGISPEKDERFKKIVEAFKHLSDENTYFVCGVDFSHVGIRYGDPYRVGEREKKEIAEYDAALIEAIIQGDKEAFWRYICSSKNSYKVCGVSPIYLLLSILNVNSGSVLHYGIWEDGLGSALSYAAIGLDVLPS